MQHHEGAGEAGVRHEQRRAKRADPRQPRDNRDREGVQREERRAAVGDVVAARRDREEPRGVLSLGRGDAGLPAVAHRRDGPARDADGPLPGGSAIRPTATSPSTRSDAPHPRKTKLSASRSLGSSVLPPQAAGSPLRAAPHAARSPALTPAPPRPRARLAGGLEFDRLVLAEDPRHDAPHQHRRPQAAPSPRTALGRPGAPCERAEPREPRHEHRDVGERWNARKSQSLGSTRANQGSSHRPYCGEYTLFDNRNATSTGRPSVHRGNSGWRRALIATPRGRRPGRA